MIKIGITQGDINGVGYELIMKTFETEEMQSLCTPIVYGSPKAAAYHKKSLGIQTNLHIVDSADAAKNNKLNIINCFGDTEHKIEFGTASQEAGEAAFHSLKCAINDLREGKIDAIVTAPMNDESVNTDDLGNAFTSQKDYIDTVLGNGRKSVSTMISSNIRIANVTGSMPLSQVSQNISRESIAEKTIALHNMLKRDFFIDCPRIAVMALNPNIDKDNAESEEVKTIIPVIEELFGRGVRCFGPYTADEHFGKGNYKNFDATLAMYHDQGMTAFKAIAAENNFIFSAGIPYVITSSENDVQYDIAGKNIADESSFRAAVYAAIDVVRNRKQFDFERRNPLKKQYFEKRDDSDKLKLDQVDD